MIHRLKLLLIFILVGKSNLPIARNSTMEEFPMRKTYLQALFVLLTMLNSLPIYAANPGDVAPSEMVQNAKQTVICKFNDDMLPDNVPVYVNEIVQQTGAVARHTYRTVFKGFSAYMSLSAAQRIQTNNPDVDYCVQNMLVTIGGAEVTAGIKGGNGGKPGQVSPQIIPEGITRVGGPIDGEGLTAWIIDSGIDLNNPDLNVDIERGFDAVNAVAKGRSTFDDVNGHGTHVAGTLAAKDNDIYVVGVAAGATVVPVRVLAASNFGYADDVIAGMDYVAANAAPLDVANMSVWGWAHNRAFHDAAYNLAEHIAVITISGNGSADINAEPTEPGHVEHPRLFTVSAIDHQDVFGDFSNWGYAGDWTNCSINYPDDPYPCATVDYAAPGKDVISLKPGGGLAEWYGTSMAAPHVAAILLLLQNTTLNPNTDGVAIGDPDSRPDPIAH
jgi:subtilisin family serine protease